MVGVGSSVPISIAHGQQNEDRANNIFSCSVLMIVSTAIVTGTLMFVFAPTLIGLMGAEESVAELAITYLRINAVMNPLTCLVFAMDNYMKISGFIRGSMLLNLFMSALQISLLILFVVVLDLGLVGSAMAINLGMATCSIIALIPFIRGKALLKFRKPKFELHTLKETIACGSPTFLNNIAGRLFSLVMNVLLIRMGGTLAVSAFSVLMYCSDLVQPFLYGLCDSMQPAIGFNWGAKAYKRVIIMRIITISREFGSGGRELGKRLADYLGVPCYDHEIIDMVAQQHGLDKNYVAQVSEKDIRTFYPTTIGHRFMVTVPANHQSIKITLAQHEVIKCLAEQGDCVIVGRCADVVCRDMNPLNIFVYADKVSKLARCVSRADENERLSEKDILRKMKQIDKDRAAYRELFTEDDWGKKESYHLCVNTSGKEIKALVPAIAEYAKLWFEQK